MTLKAQAVAPPALVGLFLVILLLASACTPQPVRVTREPVTLHLVAADSFAPLLGNVTEAYEESRPWVTVTSETLSASLAERVAREGGADLALLSWVGDPNDEGQLWTEGLARDGVAVIVHPNSPLEETGQAQLQEIFRGRLQEWDGTALTVVSREDGAGTRAAFESIALEGADTTLNAVVMPSSEAMIEYVASTPGTIGYVSTLWLSPVAVDQSAQGQRLDSGVRVLPVEGLLPTEQAVGDGSYPLWRQLYLASRGEPYGEAREFAQWLLQGGGLGNPGAIVNP